MAARKSERIMNLTICLLSARRFVAKEDIRTAIDGYHDMSDAAFERAFERDKEELRQLGVPVETGSNSAFFDDEVGYRIRRNDFELPPIQLDAAEAAVVALAAQTWRQGRLASSIQSAWAKLRAAGVEPDAGRSALLAPTVITPEPALEPLWQAMTTRSTVTFEYARGGQNRSERRIDPWLISAVRGRWYLLGHDHDRGEPRLFRLSRITSAVTEASGPGSYEVPADTDLRELSRRLEPDSPTSTVLLAVRAGRAPWLRRQGRPSERTAPDGLSADHDLLEVEIGDEDAFVGEVAGHGSDVLVLAPASLAQKVVDHLAGVVA